MLHDNSRAFARLCLVGLLSYASYAMCRSPLLPLLARELGASAPMVGLVVAASTTTGVFLKGAGQAVGPVVAGVLMAQGRYDVAFVLAGIVAMASPALLISLRPREMPPAHSRASNRKQVIQGIREVVAERRILVASIAHAFYFVINGTLNAFLPLFAQDRIGLDAVQIGWLFGLQTVTTLAVRPLIGAACDRLGRRGAIALGLLGCAASVYGVSLATSQSELYGAMLMYAVSVAITTAATSAYITDVAPKARFGAAHGVFGTIYDIGDASGPLVGGVLIQVWGYTPTFHLMAALAAITAAAFAWWSRPAAGA